ncbi:MAG: hypothetical protein IJX51_02240 [Clostridia bacterium]|nr:hypothetical protein [Clostridia bacterium]
MKRSIDLWQLVGFATTSLVGTLLHFLYDWTQSIWVAPFSGVNESTWEHMKLLFWPMFAFAIIQSLFFRDRKEFWCVKLKGILMGLILIPVIFYTYNGVIGSSPDWFNIAIFFISSAIVYICESLQFHNGTTTCIDPRLPISLLSVIAALFIVFTFATPEIGIFKDPLTGTYGIQQTTLL